MSSTTQHKHTNRLAREKSPYLLQHAHNPVDWFAWNDEAFEKARRENKPVFLSIGYSTCHWCHVMERESFENEKVGAYLNEHFVSIKVDREERPDVDKIYMTFVQATTGSGGWPMSVFLTPERKPFYGGTYFPPENRYGRPSFLQLLEHIHQLWETRREDLVDSAADAHSKLEQMILSNEPSNVVLTPDVLREAGMQLKRMYDPSHGGFGNAPKFPQPSHPQFLLRYAKRFNDIEAIRMVLHTCERMAAGGIHDQLGGGFARYAVDAEWLVPHFEKMLYDNAQLAQLYLDAHLLSDPGTSSPDPAAAGSPSFRMEERDGVRRREVQGETAFSAVVRDILDYVLRDMTHPDGGFYSAEDADSEGHEGKFYCWTRAELAKLLAPEEFNVACRYYGITEPGNFVDHSHPQPLPNQNVLSIVDPNLSADDQLLLASATKKMKEAQSKRIRPHRDDKVLASWNGLMLGAFARAYAVLGDEKYRAAAEKNLKFIQEKLWVKVGSGTGVVSSSVDSGSSTPEPGHLLSPPLSSIQDGGEGGRRPGEEALGDRGSEAQKPLPGKSSGTLYHRWRDGERDNVELLEGYANMLSGVIELYEATLEPQHLDFAIALADAMLAKFYDAENGGFWQSPANAKDLILRVKEDYDGAEPSGNSVAMLALLKLGAITDRKDFTAAAEKSLRLFAARLERVPQAVPYMLCALDFSMQPPQRAVVAGTPDSPKFGALLHAIHSVYQPNKVVLGNTGPVEEFARTLPAKDTALVYLCTGTTCQPPTSDAAEVRKLLERGVHAA